MSDASPLPGSGEIQELGREMIALSERGRAAMAKAADDRWPWNRDVHVAQRTGPEASTRAQEFGLGLAGRTEARNSMQAQMSESGKPAGNIGRAFELLTRSQIESLRRVARTAKGRRRLELLVGWLRDAAA